MIEDFQGKRKQLLRNVTFSRRKYFSSSLLITKRAGTAVMSLNHSWALFFISWLRQTMVTNLITFFSSCKQIPERELTCVAYEGRAND
jgi:hypothetical protein